MAVVHTDKASSVAEAFCGHMKHGEQGRHMRGASKVSNLLKGCAHQATPDLASKANVCMKHTNMETSAMPWRDV